MQAAGCDVMMLSLGADLPWVSGYEAMPLERLTMLVVGATEEQGAVLFVPELEAPRVVPQPGVFSVRPWAEHEGPVALVAELAARLVPASGGTPRVAVSDRAWSTFLLALQRLLPGWEWTVSSEVCAPLRAVKDEAEVDALARASAVADRVARALLGGEISLVGRPERDVSAEIAARLLEEGHQRVNFAIVGSGPNSASPHHEAGDRVIRAGEPVVCDFGGTLDGYCSDITRTVFTGEPEAELRRIYEVVAEAQRAGVEAARVGSPCQEVDRAARRVIDSAGFGRYFVHRTGHGIGLEEHEDPYMVEGNSAPLVPGNAFSVEPGIYVPGRYGVRIEDLVVATAAGPRPLNVADHSLVVLGP